MAAVIVVQCPKCQKQLRAPAEAQGKRVRCKNCGTAFLVVGSVPAKAKAAPRPGPAAPPPPPAKSPALPEEDDATPYGFQEESAAAAEAQAAPKPPPPKMAFDDDDPNPYNLTNLDLAPRCPHCAKEMESEDAVICLHCGYNTMERSHIETVRTYENTGMDQFMWLLPGILCILAILLTIGFDVWFWFGLQETWNSIDETIPHFSMGLRVWEVIISCFGMYKAGQFAFRRLVLNTRRPEDLKK
jgi:DNA-directed RNA polymerase subunit RPC12/RpoP